MQYISDGRTFGFSYQELRDTYHAFIEKTDEEFVEDIIAALHFACFICYFKEIPGQSVLSDTGIIHELIHIAHMGKYGPSSSLQQVRNEFRDVLKLA